MDAYCSLVCVYTYQLHEIYCSLHSRLSHKLLFCCQCHRVSNTHNVNYFKLTLKNKALLSIEFCQHCQNSRGSACDRSQSPVVNDSALPTVSTASPQYSAPSCLLSTELPMHCSRTQQYFNSKTHKKILCNQDTHTHPFKYRSWHSPLRSWPC